MIGTNFECEGKGKDDGVVVHRSGHSEERQSGMPFACEVL